MMLNRIEGILLTEEKKKEYHARYLASIKISQACQKKTIELSREGASFDQSAEQAARELESHLDRAGSRYTSGEISISRYTRIFRQTTDPGKWPAILVEINPDYDLGKAAALLEDAGFIPADNEFGGEPFEKFALFHMLHIHIPPKLFFIHHISEMTPTVYVYDADRVHRLPCPVPDDPKKILPCIGPLRDMVFPEGFPKALEDAGRDINICIIDSGVDRDHPDLKDRVLKVREFIQEPGEGDPCGHGTHVAGIALGTGRLSNELYKGISPHSKLLAARVLSGNGSGTTQNILAGMRWARDEGAHIVNLSLGGQEGPVDGRSILSRACDRLVEVGMVVCVSAGNSGPDKMTITPPGDSRNAICIGTSDGDSTAPFSSRGPTDDPDFTGPKPDLVAPGVHILAPKSGQCCHLPEIPELPGYAILSGTSMSSPVVAGLCALLLSHAKSFKKGLSPDALKQILKESARPKDEGQGAGIINGSLAFTLLERYLKKEMNPHSATPDEFKYIGKYRIVDQYPPGNFGRVYKVEHPNLDVPRAIKIPEIRIPELRERLETSLNEARHQAKLNHESIIQVHDVEQIDGKWCIIMEHAGGGSLRERLNNEGALSVDDSLHYIYKLARALEYAHTAYITDPSQSLAGPLIHYDIKPENILFDKTGSVKLADFGLSRVMPKNSRKMSIILGTPPYIGPEQLKGEISIQSEIWSLGTVFYEMLTGKSCFQYEDGDKISDFEQQIKRQEFVPVREVNPDIPEPVAEIVHTMLRSGAKGEYDTMADVVQDIKALLEPVREKEKIKWWQTTLLAVCLSFTLLFGAYYAESMHLMDIPWIDFPVDRKIKSSLPEDIRQMAFEQQFQEAVKAEQNQETFGLAYRIYENIETNSDHLELKQKTAYRKACLSYFYIEDYHLAIKNFTDFLKQYPESQFTAKAHIYLGDCYLKINRIDKAIDHFQYVYNGFPDSETRETTRIFLQRAKYKLKTQGDEVDFVMSSSLGRFLPNNKIGLILLMFQIAMLVIAPIYWRQITHWLDRKSLHPFKRILGLGFISLLIFSIIILSNYITHQHAYEKSIQYIKGIDIGAVNWIEQDKGLV